MKKRNKAVCAMLTIPVLTLSFLSGCGNSVSESSTEYYEEATDTSATETASASYDGAANATESTVGTYVEMPTTAYDDSDWDYDSYYNFEEYDKEEENGFLRVAQEPLSTFSASVDTASYSNVRRMIQDGYSPDEINPSAVRPEEFINYFSYDLNLPEDGDLFGITTEVSDCPWNAEHDLMFVGMATEKIDMSEAPASNLVFLLDVSGSMSDDDKLPLMQRSFKELVNELGEDDTISIVTYASGVHTVLKGANGSQKEEICDAIDSLYASGSTNGEGGIQAAYKLAKKYFIKGGNNRVILGTDGDLNVGISDPEDLQKFIDKKKDDGIFLSVLGFGTGNYKDNRMEALANYGNGNYHYIDSFYEAKKVLVEEMGANLVTVAKDVKLQVEFNPENVYAYRLIGYENRMLNAEDFNDDTKDAGEVGAGHQVVALYEIIPAGSSTEISLKYQSADADEKTEIVAAETTEEEADSDKDASDSENEKSSSKYANEYATVSVRYKNPDADKSQLFSFVVDKDGRTDDPSDDFVFASSVAEFAMLLSDSDYAGDASYEDIVNKCKSIDLDDEYKEEFYYMVKGISARN